MGLYVLPAENSLLTPTYIGAGPFCGVVRSFMPRFCCSAHGLLRLSRGQTAGSGRRVGYPAGAVHLAIITAVRAGDYNTTILYIL